MSPSQQQRPRRRVPDMPWGRWGDPRPLADDVRELLAGALHLPSLPPARVPEAQVRLPPSRLDTAAQGALTDAVGPGHVRRDRRSRLLHTGGKSTMDLLRRRAGDASAAPDAVVAPGSPDEVLAVLAAAAQHRIAVVPFGGGTSVTGGVEALDGGLDAVISLDVRRLDQLNAVDGVSLTATLQAGLRGPEAEELLNSRGLTLGHLPQSFEHATIGGFAATRSAGQASAGYGRFDDMVLALTACTPRGVMLAGPAGGRAPASAAGPDLRQLLLGSEGRLGVITDVTVRVRPMPETVIDEAWAFPDFATGAEALRALAQSGGHHADAVRLNDETETSVLHLTGGPQVDGCLAISSFEGEARDAAARRKAAGGVLAAHGGSALGPEPVAAWRRSRFAGPYLRDALLDAGAIAETLETATTWANLPRLAGKVREAVTGALAGAGTDPVVMCHISHVYPAGASLYYTVVCAQAADPLAQWAAVKAAAGGAIMEGGGTITHHHAVGTDHRAWMRAEAGDLGVQILRAAAATVDPAGVLNPGKLIPPATTSSETGGSR
jgi:alkyldihydroxyacetonephosphate synthase